MAMHPSGMAGGEFPQVQDLDVTVLAFAQWLSEMRSRSNTSLQQMLAEMGIIRNGITSNNTDLTEFKRNTATVQQQMQSQISDLRDKLTDAYTEIANMKKTKNQFEQEVHAEYQSLSEQLQFKTLELETLKKGYAHTHQLLQQQIIQLQTEVNELRMKGDDAHRHVHLSNEQHVNKVGEVEMAAQYSANELKRLRSDHDQAIANLAENMNRWNETLRDLSKEFHNFQKVMNVNQQRIQSSIWDVQAGGGKGGTSGPPQNGQGSSFAADARQDASEPARSPMPSRPQAGPPGSVSSVQPMPSSGSFAAAGGGGQQMSFGAQSPPATGGSRAPMMPPYAAGPQGAQQPYAVMR